MACPKSVKPGTKHKKGPFHRIGAGFVKIPPQLLTKSLSGCLRNWKSVAFDDKHRVLDTLVSQAQVTSELVVIHWEL